MQKLKLLGCGITM